MKFWIFPSNPVNYDVRSEFQKVRKINWYKNRNVDTGDIIYIYTSGKEKSVQWKCIVGEVGYYLKPDDENTYSYNQTPEFTEGPFFEMCLLEDLCETNQLTFQCLKQNGLKSRLMGAQSMSQELVNYVSSIETEMKKHKENMKIFNQYEENVYNLPLKVLKQQAENHAARDVKKIEVSSVQYERNVFISQYAKRKANGICQLCGKPAPFLDNRGNPYLESHHIVWLSEGGTDTIYNVVALCPNCHKKMHILNLQSDVKKLKSKINIK